jgi:hypothetical protein
MGHSSDLNAVSRREFLRRSAMAGVGAAVASSAFGVRLRRAATAAGPRIPALEVAGEVNAIGWVADRAIAVGSLAREQGHEPVVWTHDIGDPSWTLAATGSSFPPGTVLAAAAGLGDSFVAVGHTREVSRVETVIDDDTGRSLQLPVHAVIPAIFRSGDGVRWEQVQRTAPGAALGAFGQVATSEATGGVAVGFRSLEPGVDGAYGLVAMSSADGRRWSDAALPGVVPPRHGAVTLLAPLGSSAVLATRGIHETGLYLASGDAWTRIDPPADRATYKAAAGSTVDFLLAGVDDRARPRTWKRVGGSWRELDGLTGLPDGAMVVDLTRIGESLVAAGHHRGRGIVTEIEE